MPATPIFECLSLRCRALNRQPVRRDNDYVLCWLQQTLRSENNPVLDAAILAGRKLGKPVVVYHGLEEHYPYASDRLHTYILQASRSLEAGVIKRGLCFLRHIQRDSKLHPDLVYELAARATSIIVDDVVAFVSRGQAERVAARLPIAVLAVDGLRLIPEAALGDVLLSTPAFRARTSMLRETWLAEPTNIEVSRAPFAGDLGVEHDQLQNAQAINKLVQQCHIDHTLWPIEWCSGKRSAALQQLHWAVECVLPQYAAARNNAAETTGVSRLSPHLHFGVLSPTEITRSVLDADIESRHRWKFLDELLTWREYFHHRMAHTAHPGSYTNIPELGRITLDKHRKDLRDTVYSLTHLIRGETDDETWNAAQKQFVLEGWMHNNLRMYWGKKLIGWTTSPEIAWTIGCYVNDRFSLDGRDPATYGNMAWCFSPKRGREKPVYGTVTTKSDLAMRRRAGVNEWLCDYANRPVPETLYIPDHLPDCY